MGNCIRSPLTFCAPCLTRDAPVAPTCNEVVADAVVPHLSKVRPDQHSLQMKLDRILMERGGVYYLPPPPTEPCSPPVARRSKSGEKGQSVKILVSRQQLELLVQSQQFNERVMEFVTELGATDEESKNLFRKWKPDLATIFE